MQEPKSLMCASFKDTKLARLVMLLGHMTWV